MNFAGDKQDDVFGMNQDEGMNKTKSKAGDIFNSDTSMLT